ALFTLSLHDALPISELGVARVAADHVRGDDPVVGGLRLERAAVDRGRVGAVVGLVGGADRGGHVALVDRGGGARARAGQLVVGLVGAVEGDVGGDRLAGACGGRAELGVARVAADHVRGDDPVVGGLRLERAAVDRGRVGAVVGLVGGADRGGHVALVDRGGGARARAGQLVVGLVGAVEGDVGGDRARRGVG